jgi:hypothetical protein
MMRSIVLATILTLFLGDLLLPEAAHARRLGWRMRCRARISCSAECDATSAVVQRRASNEQAVRQLIEQLASPNRPPEIVRSELVDEPDRLVVPPEFDRRAQARIYKTIEKLSDVGVDAILPLIEHLNDDRYSITDQHDIYWKNLPIGQVCFHVLRGYLEVYHDQISYDNAHEYWGMSYCMELGFDNPQDAVQYGKHWWASRQHMSLVELQIEATRWAMNRPVSRDSENPEREQEKRENLQTFVDALRRSGKPIPWQAGSLFDGQLTE